MEMEAISHFRLLLCTSFYSDVKNTFIVSLYRRNFVLVSYLEKLIYLCLFENNEFKIVYKFKCYWT